MQRQLNMKLLLFEYSFAHKSFFLIVLFYSNWTSELNFINQQAPCTKACAFGARQKRSKSVSLKFVLKFHYIIQVVIIVLVAVFWHTLKKLKKILCKSCQAMAPEMLETQRSISPIIYGAKCKTAGAWRLAPKVQFSFPNINNPNFTNTHNQKSCPTFMLYTLCHAPENSALIYQCKRY